MIFNVKSINTVYIAGKEVDGMKRPREPPTGGNRMDIGRILTTEAAAMRSPYPTGIDHVRAVRGKAAVKACDIQQYTQRPTSSRVLSVKGMAGVETCHHERV